jgi:hypothetical protein
LEAAAAAEAAAVAEAVEAAQAAEEAEAAAAAAEALQVAEEAYAFEEEEKLAAKRKGPLPPPAGLAETFAPKQWLNDASLSFAYTCLSSERSVSAFGLWSDMKPQSEVVLLMDPAAAFWLTAQDNDSHLAEARDALKLQDRELIICPINDSSDCSSADAGTHWTLLVCWDRDCFGSGAAASDASSATSEHGFFGRFSYYDSLGCNLHGRDANLQQAETLASRLAGRDVKVSVGSCARQTNGFDCGVYVLLFSEIIASHFLEARGRGSTMTMTTAGTRSYSCSTNYTLPEPIWEKRLAAVTPKEVDDRRGMYFKALTQANAVAAAGA